MLVTPPQHQTSPPPTGKLLLGAIGVVILLALIVLLGWMINNPMLKSGFPGSPATMKANTAFCFLLSGVSLGMISLQSNLKTAPFRKKLKYLIFSCSCLMLLIALLTLSEYAFGWNLGIDQLLFQDAAPSVATPYPGRMGVNTAINFVLTGTAILLLSHKTRRNYWLAQSLGFIVGLIALLALIGHLFGVNLLQRVVIISSTMAIHTAIAFTLLSGVMLLMHPQQGFMRSLTSPLMGGLMARWLLPWAIGFPVVLGWLILRGKQYGWYDTAFMSALQVIVMTITFAILIGGTAQSMNRINAMLRQSQVELRQTNENLESRVAERTAALREANDRLQIELSQRQRAEQSWQESEERLQTFMDYTPAPSWITDIDGQILYLNRAYIQTFQLPEGDPIGKTVFDLYPAEFAQQFLDNIRMVAETDQVVEATEVAPRLDGTIANFLVYKFPMRSATGQRLVSGIAVDITDRQRAETELRVMSAVMENAVEGISRLDSQGRYTFVNPSYAHTVGYEPEAMLGMDWQQTVHPDDVEPMLTAYHQMLQDGKVEAEARGIRKDGSQFYKQVVMISAYDEQQQFNGHHCFMKDITDRKQAETALQNLAHKLEQSNQELQIFAFVASHDLKEPLRTICNFSNLLQSRCGKQLSDQGKDYINRMQSAAERMQTLIDDLLSLSRVTSQAQPFVPVDLNQVVERVLSGLEMKTQETHAAIAVEALPTLTADPTQMHQLLQNLISNALKFHGDQPPTVTIGSQWIRQLNAKGSSTAEHVQISIQDQGIGFDEQYADRIFKIFERLHGRSEYEGTGIGLAICRKIVERHNGTITAQSTPGKGSTFLITLPIQQPA